MQSPHSAGLSTPSLLTTLALLWFAGLGMRVTILAVPPVIPLIHDDLHMTETQVGLLVGLPLFMFALAAVPGALLIARWSAVRIATVGLFVIAIAAAARAGAYSIWSLYAATMRWASASPSCSPRCRRWCVTGCRTASRLAPRFQPMD